MLGPGEPGHQHHDDAGAEAQLGLAEAGVLGRHGHVAGERELAAAGERRAPHRSDGRFREMPEAHHGVEVVAQHVAPGGDAYGRGCGLLLEVEARREGTARAGHDECPDRLVGLDRIARRIELGQHGPVDRIGAFGPVEREEPDRLPPFERDASMIHRGPPAGSRRRQNNADGTWTRYKVVRQPGPARAPLAPTSKRRPAVGPRARLLEGTRGLQHGQVGEALAYDLQPDGEPCIGEAAGHRGGRIVAEVKG